MNKYVAPVLSAVVVIALVGAYALFWFLVLDEAEIERAIKIVVSVVAALVAVGISAALISRVRELKRGQENDIGNPE